MKFCKVSLLFALLVAVCFPALAQAQIELNIPFNFYVGHYKVAKVYEGNQTAWCISGNHGSVMMLTNPVQSLKTAHRSGVVFWYTGNRYSLAKIWATDHYGRDLLLRESVKTTILAEGGKYVEVAAE